MSLLILALVATAAGFALILLAGRGRPSAPATAALAAEGEALAWVRDGGPPALERLLRALLSELGYELERADRGASGAVDLVAVDRRPIRGGRILAHGSWEAPGAAVDGDAVRALLDAAQGEAAGKALLFTLGRFSDEAREAARDAPVELVDGEQLAGLVKRHLPQAWATRAV